MQGRGAGIGIGECGAIYFVLQVINKYLLLVRVGSWLAHWWHQAATKLEHYFFPDFSIRQGIGKIDAFKIEAACPVFKVVTFDTVGFYKLLLMGIIGGLGLNGKGQSRQRA